MKKYFEYKDAVSNKFWEINLKGNQVIVTFGRIGNKPQQIKKKFSTNEESKKFAETKIREKTNISPAIWVIAIASVISFVVA